MSGELGCLPLPKFVIKRDGSKAVFDESKIAVAIWKAVSAVGGTDRARSDAIAAHVIETIKELFTDEKIPSVEEIQDLVETTLIKGGHDKTAKAYILYRHQRELLRRTEDMVNNFEIISQYITQEDWRVRENSNMAYSLQGMNFNIAGRVVSNYWLGRVYPKEVAEAHKNADFHIHDLDVLGAYCVGWDLKQLLFEGFTGVRGKIASKPAKHFRSALGQIVNFFYTLQGESAGAQAFSNFDTYLAPFIRYDNLDRVQVKQALQEFIFNCAVPTRVGFQCLSEDTEILTPSGWMGFNEVKIGDLIKTFNIKTGFIEDKPVLNIFSRHYSGKMFNLKNRISDQLISPQHRVLRKVFGSSKFVLEEIESVKLRKSPFIVPVAGRNSSKGCGLSDEKIKLLAWVVSEGSNENPSFKHRQSGRITIYQSIAANLHKYKEIVSLLAGLNLSFSARESTPALGSSVQMIRLNSSSRAIHSFFDDPYDIKHIPTELFLANSEQAKLFLDTYLKGDGHENCKIITTKKEILDGLEHLCVLAGYGFTVQKKKPIIGNKELFVLRLVKHPETYIQKINEIDYSGTIWCPSTINETVVARRNGKVFITGNCPFTNITMDLAVPPHIANDPVIIGGKPMEATYGDFQEEMDLLNELYCEVMCEGDADGRPFTFPIPTYNITKDFDWNSKKYDGIWEMTAKYGIPYFSNFINSDMKPEDARSMCLHGDEEIVIKVNGQIERTYMRDLVETYGSDGWCECSENIEALSLDENYKVSWARIKNFLKTEQKGVKLIKTRDGKSARFSLNHPITILTSEGLVEKEARFVQPGDYMLSLKSVQDVFPRNYSKLGGFDFDEDLAFLLGFFTADGNYLYEPGKKEFRGLQFTFNPKNVELIYKVKGLIKKLVGYSAKEKKDPRYNSFYLYVYKKELAKLFHSFGFKKYGRLPGIIFNSPKKVIEFFLEGFFTGDGYAKRREIHINDSLLIRDLALLYSLVGVPNILKMRENSQILYLQHKHADLNKISQPVNCLYDLVPSFAASKISLVPGLGNGRMIGQKTLLKYNASSELSIKLSSGDAYPVQVVEVKDFDNIEFFYDIELDSSHRFVHSLGTITHNCCRLRLSNKELNKRGGGLFGSHPLTGSLGVVTINMARLGYLSKSENEFFDRLGHLMDLAKESLVIKRKTIERLTNQGLYPYSKFYLRSIKENTGGYWTNHFSTIGLLGMNEALINFMKKNLQQKDGQEFAIKVLNFMRNRLQEYQNETGDIFNLEATPGEGTTRRFAWADKKQFPDIIVANESHFNEHGAAPYYTNSTQLPVNSNLDLFGALNIQDPLQTLYTGGTVFHVFLGEKLPSKESTKNLVRKIASNYHLPYFSLTPSFSICPIHGYLNGEHEFCPVCERE